jgi:hypothetical protein
VSPPDRQFKIIARALIVAISLLWTRGQSIEVTAQPQSYRLGVPGGATLQASATGTGLSTAIKYLWFRNGEAVLNATSPTLIVTNTIPTVDVYKIRFSADGVEKFSDDAVITYARPGPARMLARYDFESDSADSITDSAGNFPGIASNITHVAGIIGEKALSFNGSNSFVRIPFPTSELDLAGTPYTIAFWRRTNTSGTVVSMHDGRSGEGGYRIQCGSAFTSTHVTQQPFTVTAPSEESTWLHVAFVWNGFTRTLFLNGRVAGRSATTRPLAGEGDDDLFIGSANGTNSFLRGVLDDLRIYNYALTSDEVLELASMAAGPPLTITVRGSELDLIWERNRPDAFRLEWTSALRPDAPWLPVAEVPQRTGEQTQTGQQPGLRVTTPADPEPRFYRLRRL